MLWEETFSTIRSKTSGVAFASALTNSISQCASLCKPPLSEHWVKGREFHPVNITQMLRQETFFTIWSETSGVASASTLTNSMKAPAQFLILSIESQHCGFPRRSPIQVLTRQMLLNCNNARTGILPFSYWEKTKIRWRPEPLVLHIPMPPNAILR